MLIKHTKLLAVRLPEAEKRRFKMLAASQGLTLQQAVHEAIEAWASKLQREDTPPLNPLATAPASADSQKPRRQDRAAKRTQVKLRAADATPASRLKGGQPPNPEADALAWIRQAVSLDWSKCSAVESVPGNTGPAWVVRGTRVPLAFIFRDFRTGRPFGEITEQYGLTREQLKAVLQFAAEGFVLPPSAR